MEIKNTFYIIYRLKIFSSNLEWVVLTVLIASSQEIRFKMSFNLYYVSIWQVRFGIIIQKTQKTIILHLVGVVDDYQKINWKNVDILMMQGPEV